MSPFLMMCYDVRGGGLLLNYLFLTNISKAVLGALVTSLKNRGLLYSV